MEVVIKTYICFYLKIFKMNETLKRAISGAVYIFLLLGCILYSQISFNILFGIFLAIAVYEFCKMQKLNFLINVVIAIALYIVIDKTKYIQKIDQPITIFTIFISFRLLYFLFNKKINTISTLWKYAYLIGYIILPFILIAKVPIGVGNKYNPKILITIFILIWTNDTFAYLVGKNIGKNKLFPTISPKKTIEGFIGGLIFSAICGYLLAKYYLHATLYIWLIISIIVSVFSTLGDLIESKFKRVAEIKDSGNIMPGHGGILDRLDSIIFVVPFIYLFYLILNYVS